MGHARYCLQAAGALADDEPNSVLREPTPAPQWPLPGWCKMLFHAARRAMSRDIEDGRPVPPSVMLGKLTDEASFDAILNS